MLGLREFLVGTAGFVPFGMMAAPSGAPVLRIGVMTDTHVGKTVESCGLVRKALELFKEKGAELVVNNGDIADHFYPTGYAAYRQVSEEVRGGGWRPQEIFAYAWHDAFDYGGRPRGEVVKHAPEAFEEVRRLLKAPHGHTAEIAFKGYTFLVMPQFTGSKGFLSWNEYEAKVAAACRANPGKPVFVVDHVPPRGTVYNSYNWGCEGSRRVLEKYPQVVVFSGHVHGSLRNDLFIWQKGFTVINSGCLQVWEGLLAANPPGSKKSFGVLTVDIHEDRLVARRWDVRDGSEIDPGNPWVVPLPFAAESAPYVWAKRAAVEPKPGFAPGAAVTVKEVGRPFAGFSLSFPQAASHAMRYRIDVQRRAADGNWASFAWLEMFSDYWIAPKDRTGEASFRFKPQYFDPGEEYRFSVTPINQYGAPGRPISAEAKAPAEFAKAEVVFKSDDPMKDLAFCAAGGSGKRHVAGTDGFYGPVREGSWLKLPEGLFKGPKGTRFRMVLDMRTVQPEEGSLWSIKFQDPSSSVGASIRVPTPPGDSGAERYVMDLAKKTDAETFHVKFDWGAGGRVRFDRLRIETCL